MAVLSSFQTLEVLRSLAVISDSIILQSIPTFTKTPPKILPSTPSTAPETVAEWRIRSPKASISIDWSLRPASSAVAVPWYLQQPSPDLTPPLRHPFLPPITAGDVLLYPRGFPLTSTLAEASKASRSTDTKPFVTAFLSLVGTCTILSNESAQSGLPRHADSQTIYENSRNRSRTAKSVAFLFPCNGFRLGIITAGLKQANKKVKTPEN